MPAALCGLSHRSKILRGCCVPSPFRSGRARDKSLGLKENISFPASIYTVIAPVHFTTSRWLACHSAYTLLQHSTKLEESPKNDVFIALWATV